MGWVTSVGLPYLALSLHRAHVCTLEKVVSGPRRKELELELKGELSWLKVISGKSRVFVSGSQLVM